MTREPERRYALSFGEAREPWNTSRNEPMGYSWDSRNRIEHNDLDAIRQIIEIMDIPVWKIEDKGELNDDGYRINHWGTEIDQSEIVREHDAWSKAQDEARDKENEAAVERYNALPTKFSRVLLDWNGDVLEMFATRGEATYEKKYSRNPNFPLSTTLFLNGKEVSTFYWRRFLTRDGKVQRKKLKGDFRWALGDASDLFKEKFVEEYKQIFEVFQSVSRTIANAKSKEDIQNITILE